MKGKNIYRNGIKKIDYSLYLVADSSFLAADTAETKLAEAIEGGVTIVQLRAKDISAAEFYNLALKMKMVTAYYNVPLIINDRVDIAMAVDADGIHTGQEDIPAKEVRKLAGAEKIIGISVSNIAESDKAELDGADYLGAGAMFPTKTKSDAKYVSMKELREIKKRVKIPVVAIGGINSENAEEILSAGVDGIAVVSAILGEEVIKDAALKLGKLIKNFK